MKFTEILSALVKAKIKISNNENSDFSITTESQACSLHSESGCSTLFLKLMAFVTSSYKTISG